MRLEKLRQCYRQLSPAPPLRLYLVCELRLSGRALHSLMTLLRRPETAPSLHERCIPVLEQDLRFSEKHDKQVASGKTRGEFACLPVCRSAQ